MIVALHVATGAAAGALLRSRTAAVAVGAALHALGDRIPHDDFESKRFEIASGVVGIGALALRHGPFAPATLGAIAASAPDLEHVLPLPKPGGRPLFPSHRIEGWHRAGGVPAMTQIYAAIGLFVVVLAIRRGPAGGSAPGP